MVLKLDMAKTYDSYPGSLFIRCSKVLVFSDRWMSLIRQAIYGPWISIVVNGVNHGFFQSQGGR